jgi:hypothetical protein
MLNSATLKIEDFGDGDDALELATRCWLQFQFRFRYSSGPPNSFDWLSLLNLTVPRLQTRQVTALNHPLYGTHGGQRETTETMARARHHSTPLSSSHPRLFGRRQAQCLRTYTLLRHICLSCLPKSRSTRVQTHAFKILKDFDGSVYSYKHNRFSARRSGQSHSQHSLPR